MYVYTDLYTDMESEEVRVIMRVSDRSVASCSDGLDIGVPSVNDNLGVESVDFLEDLDSYWEDINERLVISRMVSDSVIKGIVTAVEQEAAERIAAKESEMASLKESLCFHQMTSDKSESSGSPVAYRESYSTERELFHNSSDGLLEHDKLQESLGGLRSVAKEQVNKLKKEINRIRGCTSIQRIGSGSELVGLDRILQDKASESLVGVDRTLHATGTTVDTICTLVDDLLHSCKAILCEWQQEQEFQRELDGVVIQNSIRSFQEEFEEKLWDHYVRDNLNWLEKVHEVSSLRKELVVILNTLSNPETGQLLSHGSHNIDHLHRKSSGNHVFSSSSIWEGNGVSEELKNGMPDVWDVAQFKHLSKEQLVDHFNSVITKTRRNHESKVQEMTEEHFTLKREYLRERGSYMPHRKDKELDLLRKRIEEVILKLDDILPKNEKLSVINNNAESLGSLRSRLKDLIWENHQLRDSLADKKREIKCLSVQVSDAAEKKLQYSLKEMNLLKLIANLRSEVEDACIETSITGDIYKCTLKEISSWTIHATEELKMESNCDILSKEPAAEAEVTSKDGIKESELEALVMQGLCGVIYQEAIKDAESHIKHWNTKYLSELNYRDSLEHKALEKEDELEAVTNEKEGLEIEVLLMKALLKENEKLVLELSMSLAEERERSKVACEEIIRQQSLLSESSKQLDLIRSKLVESSEQNEKHDVEKSKLKDKLEALAQQFTKVVEERQMLLAANQEKLHELLLLEAKEKEQRERLEALSVVVHVLSNSLAKFEDQVSEVIKKDSLRIKELGCQLRSLTQKVNILKNTGMLYKQQLERRCADLQLAEAEVDLLGDQVDVLLGLLGKIYIALDHYSPILQHYPGIMEILKLVKRESTKPV